MLKIDAHHHFWKYNTTEYGWIDDSMKVIKRDFLPADLKKNLHENGISYSVAVQASQTIAESRWLLELAEQNEFIAGVVGWAPLIDPNVGKVIDELAVHPKLRGLRHIVQDEPDEQYILRPDFNRGIKELKRKNLTYHILIFERHLPQTIKFVDQHPGQVFVLDHLAKPRVKYNAISPWREHLRELAKRPHIYCKISGLATEADHAKWTERQLQPYLDTVLEVFGPQRLMFGSDWPVCLLAIRYSAWVSLVTKTISRFSEAEQARIWAGTAREAYRLYV